MKPLNLLKLENESVKDVVIIICDMLAISLFMDVVLIVIGIFNLF